MHVKNVDKFIFNSPTTINIVGPTSSEKTQFLYKILKLKENMFCRKFDRIVWCYSVWQKEFKEFDDIIFLSRVV